MRAHFLFIVFVFLLLSCREESFEPNLSLVPRPQWIEKHHGYIDLADGLSLRFTGDLQLESEVFRTFLRNQTDILINNNSDTQVKLRIDPNWYLGQEGYQLSIHNSDIQVISNSSKGISRGLSTLQQLILLNESSGLYLLPELVIEDYSNFEHRGLLLDCSRHFFAIDVVKKYIDLLAIYKMNTLHWHLTEDQGWRIEIEKYPRLTEIASFRTEPDGRRYGGFYTKEEIREVVSYAEDRNIEVIPEIELPGHSQAALAAYPHLSCKGHSIDVANDWGVFKEIYCAGNDSVFIFLEDVLTEVMELFPSKKIHIGGDEAPKVRWEKCPKCQKRIQEEGLKDEHELQSYFIRRIQSFLHDHNREMIGWDEILEGGLAKGAVVQSWRGMEGGIEAVRHGNKAIMSPTSHAYFDYSLDAIDLKKVYSFNPIPDNLTEAEAKLIIGGECNMWTERVPTEANLDSRVFPWLLAMAEVLWSADSTRDFTEFSNRVSDQYSILDSYKVDYGRECVALSHEMILEDGVAFIKLTPNSPDIDLNFRYMGSKDSKGITYSSPVEINRSGSIRIQPTRDARSYGDSIIIPLSFHHGIDSEVSYESEFSDWYTAGGSKGLVDAKIGTLNFRDGAWQGFWGDDLKCTIELRHTTELSEVSANFYQYNNSWIFIPQFMRVQVSMDGENWREFGMTVIDSDPKQRGSFIKSVDVISDETVKAKYIRVEVKNIGKVPDWHEAAGSDAWVFIDEIRIK